MISVNSESCQLLEGSDIRKILPPRTRDSHKGTYGYIALIGGSIRYSGAIRLANIANASMRSGAGVTKLAAPASLSFAILPYILESTFFPLSETPEGGAILFKEPEFEELIRGTRAVAFGMGIGNSPETKKALIYLLSHYNGILIIDADGLNALSELLPEHPSLLQQASPRVVLTPHLKEFSRLSGLTIKEIQDTPISAARSFAQDHHCTVLLKGSSTTVTDGENTYITDRGCPGMATAGSGDVLSGVLAAVLGQAPDHPCLSAAAGAYIAGLAGELAQEESCAAAMIASDTAVNVKKAMTLLLS